ncbi:MAG: acyl-CoA/acyl-ACP dehydrogenase [Phenylobacterium sp.]|uniref:acyl-CoA dehydrogenase family protein n=1 Tax=Phenylobacterium sp. TaxID=1871053 RepID=UPI0025D398D1|nr:acyl-CoA dehydrogenase family protein [Phenylobacterium sp.]MCA3711926.1 acyl-CoA/acyl-ACP dehydrogenase [Phenylobacterium sp.]MCA3729696.1 acyl-CoA/acyl-ACP dehydrogenase [Phenylobacterium sp.]MCA3747309.1 acyl-CoA/acyl-ACP dehydrogenase [Phenylobacterium sp.]MCA3751142.1 acyl-CoA/acyl-ACP dehydrogenase [Phenylobacterium sp.]MCA4916460.1 acyl-CoA/acyl-ACP dehydrogenase [Phenylobacterium sp.]
MQYGFTDEQQAIRESVLKLCSRFGAEYWRSIDETGQFPEAFVSAMCEAGWLGAAMPVELGGSGLGLTEAAIAMQAVAESGAGYSGASAVHLNIFGPMPLARFGTDEQKRRLIPRLISGEDKMCFGVTEPDAGLDTTSLSTRAVRTNDGYVLRGRKMWTTMAQRATKMLIVARTTPRAEVKKATDGISLFYVDFDREKIQATPIRKMGRKAIDSNAVFIDDLYVPADALVGEEGRGFYYLLEGLNPERVLIGAEAVGLGRAALGKASAYARERVVFGRPIGKNQGVAHPLARVWAELEAANLMTFKAAALYDAGQECGAEANAAKYLGGEAGFHACEAAVLAHGGMGYAKEYDVERYFREAMIPRIAPVSREMIFNFIAERVLGLPRSY